MIQLIINGIPVSWKAHLGYGKNSYSPRYEEKKDVQRQIKAQWPQERPLCGAVRIAFTFCMPVPKGTSKAKTLCMLEGLISPIKRPDIDNLQKFASDCLIGIAFEDDSQVVDIHSKKIFVEKPCTMIHIENV